MLEKVLLHIVMLFLASSIHLLYITSKLTVVKPIRLRFLWNTDPLFCFRGKAPSYGTHAYHWLYVGFSR